MIGPKTRMSLIVLLAIHVGLYVESVHAGMVAFIGLGLLYDMIDFLKPPRAEAAPKETP